MPVDETTRRMFIYPAAGHRETPVRTDPRAAVDLSFLRTPGRLGPYKVLDLIGQGGMGLVLRAEDAALNRLVALKVLRPEQAADPRAAARFVREARAAAAVEHDHVVPIFHVGEDHGTPFLAMPLLKGQTLQTALAGDPRWPADELCRVGREIADGLAAAHARGLVHRDIKPANIWLEGPTRRVRILDFGLARSADVGETTEPTTGLPTVPDGTQAGMAVGTPGFMAPEQAGGQPLDHRADLFSLGCVLYLMAVGRPAFPGAAVTPADEPVRAGGVRPDLPAPLADLIARLLARDPTDRPLSAAGVADELRAIEAVLSAPPPPRGFRWRATGAAAVAAVLVSLVVAGEPRAAIPYTAPADLPPAATPAEQRELAELVIRLGGTVTDADGTHLTRLDMLSARPLRLMRVSVQEVPAAAWPAFFDKVCRLDGLSLLYVGRSTGADPDADLERLAASRAGQTIDYMHYGKCDRATVRGLAALARMPKLITLAYHGPAATDEAVPALLAAPHLRRLSLFHTSLTDAGLARLADGRFTLFELDHAPQVTNAGLVALTRMPKLECLFLHGTGATADGLPALAAAGRLRVLALQNFPLSDDDVPHLGQLPGLTELRVDCTRLTAAGVGELSEALPRCRVKWNGGVLEPRMK